MAEHITGMDRGYLFAVRHGTKPASDLLLRRLGIIKPAKARKSLNLRVDLLIATRVSHLIRSHASGDLDLMRFAERVDKLVTKRGESHSPLS